MSGRDPIQAYPLAWPTGWKRTKALDRKNAQFNVRAQRSGSSYTSKRWLTVNDSVTRLRIELAKMGVGYGDMIISTNVPVRLDGLPLSGEKEPNDPGAAVYWQTNARQPMRCMAIDRYNAVADNLAAIAATLEAMRAIERHGGAEILERAFSGFKQLAAENEGPSWSGVLQVRAGATIEEIQTAYRSLAKIAHPDSPTGNHEAMESLNAAREQGLNAAKGRG